jgi:hypothetical protein
LVRQGYRAWLHARELEGSPETVSCFAELMTDGDRRTYEGLRREEVEQVLGDE